MNNSNNNINNSNNSNNNININNSNNSNNNINIGVVIHGPTIIDSSCAKYIINILNNFKFKIENKLIKPNINYKLGGTSGRIAIIDNKLENIVDISEKLLPSESLNILNKNNDLLILMNYGLSKETGHTFGKIVVEKSNIKNKTIIQIERPKEKDSSLIIWNSVNTYDKQLINYLSEKLKLSVEYGDNINNYGLNIKIENNKTYRKIIGVNKGDNILLNGICVGIALNSNITIVWNNNTNEIIDIINGNINFESLKQLNNFLKLNNITISNIIVKTGYLRKISNNTNNNSNNYNYNYNNHNKNNLRNNTNKIILLNNLNIDLLKYFKNNRHSEYNYIAIGNNNTTYYGDLLYRFNKKIIGIKFKNTLTTNIINNPKITKNSTLFLIENSTENNIYLLLNKNKNNLNNLSYNNLINNLKKLFNENNIKYSCKII